MGFQFVLEHITSDVASGPLHLHLLPSEMPGIQLLAWLCLLTQVSVQMALPPSALCSHVVSSSFHYPSQPHLSSASLLGC